MRHLLTLLLGIVAICIIGQAFSKGISGHSANNKSGISSIINDDENILKTMQEEDSLVSDAEPAKYSDTLWRSGNKMVCINSERERYRKGIELAEGT